MSTRIRSHIRSNVVGYMALVVALSGAAYANHENIKSSDIVNNQVKTVDVRNDSLNGGGLKAADLRAGSVAGSEVVDGALTGADINEASLGVLQTTTVRSLTGTGVLEPDCNPGEVATGAGYTHVNTAPIQFRPQETSGTPTGWSVALSDGSDEFVAYVICAGP